MLLGPRYRNQNPFVAMSEGAYSASVRSRGSSVGKCRYGVGCSNPNPDLVPTDLSNDSSESRRTGVCSHCRKAGRTGFMADRLGGSEAGPVFGVAFMSAEDAEDAPPIIVRGEASSLEPHDVPKGMPSDYDSFDPDAESLVPPPIYRPATIGEQTQSEPHEEEPIPRVVESVEPAKRHSTLVSLDEEAPKRKTRAPRKEAPVEKPIRHTIKKPDEHPINAVKKEGVDVPSALEETAEPAQSISSIAKDAAMAPSKLIQDVSSERPGGSLRSNAGVAAREGVAGAFDIARQTWHLCAVALAFGAIVLSRGAPRKGGITGSIARRGLGNGASRWFSSSLKKLLLDHRRILATGGVLAFLGTAGYAAVAPLAALNMTAVYAGGFLGLGLMAAHIAVRVSRALLTGKGFSGSEKEARVKEISRTDWQRNDPNNFEYNTAFEQAAGDLFGMAGFKVKQNGVAFASANGHSGGGDGGFDIFLQKGGKTYLVSCKRYGKGKSAGDKEVRDIFAVATDKTNARRFQNPIPVLVTTEGFTQPARKRARDNGVLLYTLDELIDQVS